MIEAVEPARVLSETTLTFARAADRVPARGGGHPHPSTVFRWATRGVRGAGGTPVRLEAARVGSTWYTSAEAVTRFIAALTALPGASPARSPGHRRRAAERAARELQKLGC